jgi:hypothetical protein
MDKDLTNLRKWLIVAVICGIIANINYVLATQVSISPTINRLLFFSFGPLLITTTIGLYKLLSTKDDLISIQLGTVFLILSGVCHTIMATMQGSISTFMKGYISNADNESQKELLMTIYKSVFSTQAGVDMTFDIFISLGVIMLAYSMWNNIHFGKIVSIMGILFAGTGLLFNLIAFPENAGNIGLIDPSPLFGIWFLIVTIQMALAIKKV